MQRCVFFKNIDQKLAGQDTIYGNPCPLILRQNDFIFHYDECSCFYFSHLIAGFHQLCDSLVGKLSILHFVEIKIKKIYQNVLPSEIFQCLAHLRLEDHDHSDHCHVKQFVGDPDDRIHFKQNCKQNKGKDHKDSTEKHPRSRIFDPNKHIIDQH